MRNILESMLLEAMFQAPDDDVATVLVDDMAVRGEEPSSYSARSTTNSPGGGDEARREGAPPG